MLTEGDAEIEDQASPKHLVSYGQQLIAMAIGPPGNSNPPIAGTEDTYTLNWFDRHLALL